MSTVVVNPDDVIVVNDSIAVKMSKVIEILQPVVKGAETNWQDVIIAVAITFAVCATIIIVAWIAKIMILSWKDKVIESQKNERTDIATKEEEESDRKREFHILDKKLQILCDTCYELSKEEPKKVVKKYSDGAVVNYISALDDALRTKSTSKNRNS
ncbi:MAG: hypothetical protein E7080_08090 [Bacteroidales bacterium]|nr:hypothetical protein [Bacteroidales bacterium]